MQFFLYSTLVAVAGAAAANHSISQPSSLYGSIAPHNSTLPHIPASSRSSVVAPTSVSLQNGSHIYKPLYEPHRKTTPVFQNASILQALHSPPGHLSKRAKSGLPEGVCAPGQPCVNGACCSKTGVCSYAPSSCAPENCISNCNATAPCGQYAKKGPDAICPLNVCCSQYGFCGTTDEFCGTGCQAGFGGCGPAPTPGCAGSSSTAKRIGYYESWANTRNCDKRAPEDIDLTGLTHLNFAFAFFDPSSYQVSPMDAPSGTLFKRFTALKAKKASLQTWISIGGWSFNDDTNTPNTRTAFSNMVSSSGTRSAWINALKNFMQTYGFDGVDIDWEYPGADDRGGQPTDGSNFSKLIAEMRASFGPTYGISATLPSSYWYMQHFDLLGMQNNIDWFNFMSYDIHGTWDSSNRFTGPYIRPHTNLTEIKDGLSLLWRAGVQPGKVVLGLGWYGRSFTLSDPGCNTPNGVCQFTAGGSPGSCTNSAGTLSNAEIKRVIASGTGTQGYDATAAVRWLTWNGNQWVSYDDGKTMQQKIDAANSMCLGGTMIWSIDQDNSAGDSMSDLLGIGVANGVSGAEAQSYKDQLNNATLQQDIASSCYWSFCGAQCSNGYFGVTEARGQIASIQQNSVCQGDQLQTLCCAPQTTMGQCQWEGFRGVGLPCTPVCDSPTAIIVAQNTNSYQLNEDSQLSDQTCTGGYQAYCCDGFKPSPKTNTGNLFLYGQGALTRRDIALRDLEERGIGKGIAAGALTFAGCAAGVAAMIAAAPFTFGLSLIGEPGLIAACAAAGIVVVATGFASKPGGKGQPAPKAPPLVTRPYTGEPTTLISSTSTRSSYGQWPILDFGNAPQTQSCDCYVTYTCRYGMGWDEVCDNQRWGIDKFLNGQTVFQVKSVGRAPGRKQASWAGQRSSAFRTRVQGGRPQGRQCQVDEFPMGNLEESGNNNPQACRLVNQVGNGAQGNDFNAWKSAQWSRCSSFRKTICRSRDPPPATWKFHGQQAPRGSANGQHFIQAYGFDSQTANSLCFAEYTYTDANKAKQTGTISDHGFRAENDDAMFGAPFNWPVQDWKVNPAPIKSSALRPTDVASANWLRKRDDYTLARNLLGKNCTATRFATAAIPAAGGMALGNNNTHLHVLPQNETSAYYVDMDGNPIDEHDCDIVYTDEDHESSSLDYDSPYITIVNADGDYEVVSAHDLGDAPPPPETPITRADARATTSLSQPPQTSVTDSVPAMTLSAKADQKVDLRGVEEKEGHESVVAPTPTRAPRRRWMENS